MILTSCRILKRLTMIHLMKKKWLEMIDAFLKLTPRERSAEAEKRLDESLERMAQLYDISRNKHMKSLLKIVTECIDRFSEQANVTRLAAIVGGEAVIMHGIPSTALMGLKIEDV